MSNDSNTNSRFTRDTVRIDRGDWKGVPANQRNPLDSSE